ncbi:MAG: cell envelope integrity protein TolA [Rhizobiaceae bacterium]
MSAQVIQLQSRFAMAVVLSALLPLGPKPALALEAGHTARLGDVIARCWNLPLIENVGSLTAKVSFQLDPNGALAGNPQIIVSSGNRPFDESALRAIKKCAPFDLPRDRWEEWKSIVVNFDPQNIHQ